jgi:two-component system nitrate/nitrite response regulator NarL
MLTKPDLRKQSGDAGAAATALTHRERQIVGLVSEGLSNKQIGRRLNVTDGTVKVHLHNIFEKLQVSNRTALAWVYLSSRDQAGQQPDHSDLYGI